MKTIAILLATAISFGAFSADKAADSAVRHPADVLVCPGGYGGHLQGLATDGRYIYWSFTVTIVKTDLEGKILATRNAPYHQGDLCVKDGTVYVAVNRGKFNHRRGAVSEVTAYDAGTLEPLKTWTLGDMPHGAGGMTWRGDRFFVVGGLPPSHECNYVYEYDQDFNLVERHVLDTGFTLMGIQTAAYEDGRFLFGIYGDKGNPDGVIAVENDLKTFKRYRGGGNVGMLRFGGRYYVGHCRRDRETKKETGFIKHVPGFLGEKSLYSPRRNGGDVRIFYTGRDRDGWKDCGYVFVHDGLKPLSNFNAAFRKAGTGGVRPAVMIDGKRECRTADLVRGVRRTAECNEETAFCFAGTPESVAADGELAEILAAIRKEAATLGVRLTE